MTGSEQAIYLHTHRTYLKLFTQSKCSPFFLQVNDFSVATLCAAVEQNQSLKSLNLESNRISPDQIAELFETIAAGGNGLIEVRVAAQAQEKMGHRVEDRIATAVCKNGRLLRLGMSFEFPECKQRVASHLIENVDKIRRKRLKDGIAPGSGVQWTAARTID